MFQYNGFNERGVQIHDITFTYCAPHTHTHTHTHTHLSAGVGVEPRTKFSKRGGLTAPQLLERVSGKEGTDFFQVGLHFSHKK